MVRQNRGWLYASLAQVFWGTTGIIITFISKALPSTLLVAVRHGIGAVLLGGNIAKGQRRVLKNLPWAHLICLGIFAALPDLLMVAAVRRCGPVVAILLARLEIPLGVLFAHLLLKEKVAARAYLASIVALIGGCLISYKPGLAFNLHSGFYVGVVIGASAGLIWAFSTVYGKFILNKQVDPLALTFVRLGVGSLFSLAAGLILVTQPFVILRQLGLNSWLWLVYLGIFCSGVGYLLFYRSMKLLEAHVVQVLVGLSIAVLVLLSLVIGQAVTGLQWLGVLVITCSIYLVRSGSKQMEAVGD